MPAVHKTGEQEQSQATAPDMMGSLTNMLDANKDGSVLDDIGGIAKKIFGSQ